MSFLRMTSVALAGITLLTGCYTGHHTFPELEGVIQEHYDNNSPYIQLADTQAHWQGEHLIIEGTLIVDENYTGQILCQCYSAIAAIQHTTPTENRRVALTSSAVNFYQEPRIMCRMIHSQHTDNLYRLGTSLPQNTAQAIQIQLMFSPEQLHPSDNLTHHHTPALEWNLLINVTLLTNHNDNIWRYSDNTITLDAQPVPPQ